MLFTFVNITASDTAAIWSVAAGVISDVFPIIAIVGGILLVGLVFSIFLGRK